MKKRIDTGKLVREVARDVIGQPKAVRKRTARKAGGSRTALDPTLNRNSSFVRVGDRQDSIEGAPRLATVGGLRMDFPVTMNARKTRDTVLPGLQYSPQVIEHANVILRTQGEKALADYLNGAKTNMTTSLDMAETMTQAKEERETHRVNGSIEHALEEAQNKARYWTAQRNTAEAEFNRWTQIADNLREVQRLAEGPAQRTTAQRTSGGNGEGKKARGHWPEVFRELLTRRGKPIKRSELINLAAEHEGAAKGTVYPVLRSAILTGKLLDIGDGVIGLPEWTEPERAA